jgi:hypothetical protein
MRSRQARFEDGHRVHFKRTVFVPGTRIALLSRPTKLPGPSWSLPAGPACPFRRNGPNTICGSCYADDVGRYSQAQIKRAQWARFDWTRECLRTSDGTATFVRTMVEAIDAAGYLYMRVHDSGDLFSAAYTRRRSASASRCPGCASGFQRGAGRRPGLTSSGNLPH